MFKVFNISFSVKNTKCISNIVTNNEQIFITF